MMIQLMAENFNQFRPPSNQDTNSNTLMDLITRTKISNMMRNTIIEVASGDRVIQRLQERRIKRDQFLGRKRTMD